MEVPMGEHRTQRAPDYKEDFFAWSQHQAKLLRTFRRWGADFPSGLDLDQIAEEIESLGSAELNSVKSLIRQILMHLIKAASDPASEALAHWRAEAAAFHSDMLDHYAPSMRQLIDMQLLWQRAKPVADLRLREYGSRVGEGIPEQCPYALKEIVAESFDFDEAVARLQRISPA
jgi:hypothetical protein